MWVGVKYIWQKACGKPNTQTHTTEVCVCCCKDHHPSGCSVDFGTRMQVFADIMRYGSARIYTPSKLLVGWLNSFRKFSFTISFLPLFYYGRLSNPTLNVFIQSSYKHLYCYKHAIPNCKTENHQTNKYPNSSI